MKKFEKYIFSGKKIALECIYNAEEELFMVHKIMPLSADRKVSNIKRGFTIEGVIKFIDNRRRFNLSRISENNNEKLIIQFKNNKKNKATLQKQDELFDNLFGYWSEGLDESIINEKERVGKVIYSDFEIIDNQLLLTLEEYKNNDIDEIENDTKYIVEYKDQRGNLFLFDVGTYHEINYDKK